MLIYRVEWPERWIEEFGGGAHKGRKNVMFVQTCVSIFVKTRIIYLIYNDEWREVLFFLVYVIRHLIFVLQWKADTRNIFYNNLQRKFDTK